MALTYLVAVAVGVGVAVGCGVLDGRVGVADGVFVGCNRLLPTSERDTWRVGATVYVGGTSAWSESTITVKIVGEISGESAIVMDAAG